MKKEIAENPQESRKEWMLRMACPTLDAGMERVGKKNSNNSSFQFWQQHKHPIELNTNDLMQQKLDYIHQNPVEAGFVSEPQHYLYSSALDYSGEKGAVGYNAYRVVRCVTSGCLRQNERL
ncbi:MAG: hypothetical protein NWS46_01540 [Cyclobacteriaceae bacterium]|nr:hypothetical protein [Cyclobacteriaceae bacterium]